MAGSQAGKLRALAWLIREHREVVELTLIQAGLRLRRMGEPDTSWRDIWAVVAHAARTPGSPLAAALDPRASWPVETYLLADAVDSLRFLAWAKSKDGQKNRNRPKAIPRPGRKAATATDVQAMPVDELKRFLARPRIATP